MKEFDKPLFFKNKRIS